MRTLAEISDHELRVADWINAVDETSTHWETLWGLDEPAALPTARQQRIVEFTLAQDDEVGLLNAIARVEQVKGRLAPRVEALREVLKRSTSTQTPAQRADDPVQTEAPFADSAEKS